MIDETCQINIGSRLGGRYDTYSRWVDILASETSWTVCNMGVNGRELPLPIIFIGAIIGIFLTRKKE